MIGVLGPLEVRDDAGTIDVSGARLRLLLALLAVECPRALSPSALVDALWGEQPPADETNALQSLVSRLRKALGDSSLVVQSAAGYRLGVDPDQVDAHRFSRLAREGRDRLREGDVAAARDRLADALALWRADPVELAGSDVTAAFLARLEEQRIDAHADLIEARVTLGESDDVIHELEGLVALHPLRERLAGLLVQALYAAGRQAEALASYERTREGLAETLGVDPSPELKAIHLRVLRGEPASGAVEGRVAIARRPLRATLTSFVGRDDQLAQIAGLLDTGRLVTLVGPGGAGKTRLAGEAAARVTSAGTDGVWLVELAPVTDPADVPQTVLGALGLRDAILLDRASTMNPRDAMGRLLDALGGRTAVVVLDNCEHLIEAAAQLTDQLLADCPGLRILATSREPLGIFGEATLVVPPLGAPGPMATPAEAVTFPAVQLFVDRAAAAQPGFTVDATSVAPVIEIVRRLDGQPLAIELAAARLRTLPVAEIARRLSDRFRLLTGGSRTAMPRHRTLRAVVEWSWDLLDDSERLLAERLAVFSGGVTANAAAAVCGGPDLPTEDVDDLLSSLVDKSLLQISPSTLEGPRYRMLETIREFGLDRMADREEVGEIRLRHAQHFAALAIEADPHLRRAEQLEWMAVLDAERDNILAALKYLADAGLAQEAIDLANLLGWYWMTIGSHGDIVTWLSVALAADGPVNVGDRLMAEAYLALNSLAGSATNGHDEIQADIDRLTEIIGLVSDLDQPIPTMLVLLAPVISMFFNNAAAVPELIDRALNHDDPWIAAAIRTFRAAQAENEGNVDGMRADAAASLAAFRELGDRWGMANSLRAVGQLELLDGRLDEAAAAYREGIECSAAIGSDEDVAIMRLRLAEVLARQGEIAEAAAEADQATQSAADSGSPMEVLLTTVVQVELALSRGDVALARELRDSTIGELRRLPAIHPVQSHGLAVILASSAKIDTETGAIEEARTQLVEAHDLAVQTKDMPILAIVGLAVARLAIALDRPGAAAEILGAAAELRGSDDLTNSDVIRLADELGGLFDGRYAAAYRKGSDLSRAAAIARVHPDTLA